MHQDSQTFSDITAIDTRARLSVIVTATAHGDIEYIITLNKARIESGQHQIDLIEPICLEVDVVRCIHGAVEIGIEVQGKELLPIWGHLTSSGSCYINHTGKWRFQIPMAFYPWYFEQSGVGAIF